MPSQRDFDAGRRLLVAAGTAHFEKLADRNLLQVPHEIERIAAAFTGLGYERLPCVTAPDRDELRKLFGDVKKNCADGDFVVAYYTSHGVREQDRFYLLTRESDLDDLDETALPAEDLARALCKGSKAAQVLVILDVCYAAAGAAEVIQIASRLSAVLGEGPGVFVVAAARPKQEADQGALSLAIAEALSNRDERMGGHTQRFLFWEEVTGPIGEYLKKKHPAQMASWSAVNVPLEPCRLFPNPHYRPEIPPGLDLETQRAFIEHWVPKARGAELGAGGWYFTGREQAMRELAEWLRETSSGGRARVVTGGTGCGKSALLARVVTLSNPTYRKEVLAASGVALFDPATLPPEEVVNVAVHARRMLLADVVAHIAAGLHLIARDADELVEELARRPETTVIIVDALDEADDKARIVSKLLSPLATLPQIFLLIGTRPDTPEQGRRFGALGEATVEIDLDDPRYVGPDDVARYVERRLLATEEPRRETPYRKSPSVAREVALALSARARNIFLVAHTAVLALLARPSIVDVSELGWIDRLPTGLDDAFSLFLGELDTRRPGGLSSSKIRAVFLPLAFAEGEGLPWTNVWATVATAISGTPVNDNDIALVREHAAAFIVEALGNDCSVYRLYHEKVTEHLRGAVDDFGLTQQRIVKALRSLVPITLADQQPDWMHAHPYILTHLASHALKAGGIGELAVDGVFLAAADPLRTMQALEKSADPFARRAYASYALAFHNLRDRRIEDHFSYLEMAARQIGDDALAEIWTRRPYARAWKAPWVRSSPVSPHRVIPTSCRCLSVALGTLEDRQVVVSGGWDGTVRVWDLVSGAPRGEPLRGHDGWVNSVALGTVDNRPVIVSGGLDGTVRVWDLATGVPCGEPMRGHEFWVTSVALGTFEAQPVIASGGEDGTVRVWDLASGMPIVEPLRGHDGSVSSVALGTLKGRPVVVSGGEDGTVRVWDLASSTSIGKLLHGHEVLVTSVALGMIEGRPVVVSGGTDGLRVWDLASGVLIREPYYRNSVTSVALGTLKCQTVIVSGGFRDVRVWDLASGAPIGEPLRGHGVVNSVALDTFEGRPVIVSGGDDGSVRVWDLGSGTPIGKSLRDHRRSLLTAAMRFWNLISSTLRGEPLRGHVFGRAISVALGTLNGRSVIVSGGNNGTVQVWDLATGKPIDKPLRVQEYSYAVNTVALGIFNGRPMVVSGGGDGTVRVWDLASRTPIGEPLRGHEKRRDVSSFDFDEYSVYSVAVGMLEGRPLIVSGGVDGTVRVWDLISGTPIGGPLRGHHGGVNSVALGTLEDRQVVVSGGWDGTVRVWDLVSGAPRGEPLRGHDGWVNSVALGTVDNRPVIVSGGSDGTVQMWGLASGVQIGKPLRGHESWVKSVALGAFEGQPVIVSGGADGTVRVWDDQGSEYATIYIAGRVQSVACTPGGTVVAATTTGLTALQFAAR